VKHVVRDGTRVLFLASEFSSATGAHSFHPVRAFAIGEHAVIRKHTLLPEDDEPLWVAWTIGYLRPGFEGVRWCRGWKGKSARALLAQLALENSR